ncbi:MAG: hypothetical protein IPM97_11470 [Bdellovibrionaceae bacterium]|nr:hypothetical protein [Pseudobdellovibrionaceae bacterium]
MSRLLGLFALSLSIFFPLLVTAGTRLSAEYKLTGHIYRGSVIPPFNPNLNLTWTFFENGTDRLYWDRKGEIGFCERFANYTIENEQITEVVFAANPNNSFECSKDPDMLVGRKTTTKFKIVEQQLLLYLQLGDEELVYIFKEIQ